MIAGVRVKVCGLRSLVDAEAADAIGADYLGFIFH
ncbi:MAG: phosphoribosylanthranilate isomerase, partial [Verrucomicrobia bacterium]